MTEPFTSCGKCTVPFELKTPRTVDGYHVGCYAAMRVAGQKCSHYTPAEDSSEFAFAHRTFGCPDEGHPWPEVWKKDLP